MKRTHTFASLSAPLIAASILAAPAAAQTSCEWTLVDPMPGLIAVTDVEARSADEAFAFGYYEGLIRWDGTAWSQFVIDDPHGSYPSVFIDNFCLAGTSHLYLCGRGDTGPFSNDQVIRFWDGESWSDWESYTLAPDIMGWPRNGAASALVAVDVDDVWILGRAAGSGDGSGEAYLTLHWDGSDLTEGISSGGPGNASKVFNDGVAFATNDIWAVGQYRIIGAGTPGYHAATYHYDGTNWDYIPNPAEGLCCQSTDLNSATGVAPDDVWAAGSYGQEPLFMHYDGSSWTIVPGPPGALGTVHQIVAIASDDVWAVDSSVTYPGFGKFYHWDGTAWSVVPGQEIPGAEQVERHGGLAAVGPCDVWAVGSYNFGVDPVLPLIERLQPVSAPSGDINGDGVVNFADVLAAIGAWGPCAGACPADLDGSGDVGFGDILVILANWS
ncbi:MAG: hypothetical protein ACYTGP_01905 [Planctomycetota bacterium]